MIIPWYDNPSDPNAWHHVRAPGGYEWWQFDADDASGDLTAQITFYDGFAFDPEYLRRYRRYRRWPTKHAPPVAREFPCVTLLVRRDGSLWVRSVERFPPGTFVGSPQRLEIRMGENRLAREDGELVLSLAGGSRLTFRPGTSRASEEWPLGIGGEHRWIRMCPRWDVEGVLCCRGERVKLQGTGYHHHQFGTGPIALESEEFGRRGEPILNRGMEPAPQRASG
jgi:hypothetical protein